MIIERCIGDIKENNKIVMDSLKANDDIKMTLLMSMQKAMQKLVKKL